MSEKDLRHALGLGTLVNNPWETVEDFVTPYHESGKDGGKHLYDVVRHNKLWQEEDCCSLPDNCIETGREPSEILYSFENLGIRRVCLGDVWNLVFDRDGHKRPVDKYKGVWRRLLEGLLAGDVIVNGVEANAAVKLLREGLGDV